MWFRSGALATERKVASVSLLLRFMKFPPDAFVCHLKWLINVFGLLGVLKSVLSLDKFL